MVTTEEAQNDTTVSDNGTEKKERKRIDPRVKMVKALHSILGDHLRHDNLAEAQKTANSLLDYLKEVNND